MSSMTRFVIVSHKSSTMRFGKRNNDKVQVPFKNFSASFTDALIPPGLLCPCCEMLCGWISHITVNTGAWEIWRDCCFWKQKNAVKFLFCSTKQTHFKSPVKGCCLNIFMRKQHARYRIIPLHPTVNIPSFLLKALTTFKTYIASFIWINLAWAPLWGWY